MSERSLWYDGKGYVRHIRNFRIGTSLSNQIRIGTSDSNSNRILKLCRSLNFFTPGCPSCHQPTASPRLASCSFDFPFCVYSTLCIFQERSKLFTPFLTIQPLPLPGLHRMSVRLVLSISNVFDPIFIRFVFNMSEPS